jgi:threonine synthase
MRGFADLEREGLAAYPLIVGVQAAGCAPLVRAYEAGRTTYERWDGPRTIAHAIANPTPPAGDAVLRTIRERRGVLVSVSDEEMLAAQRKLASAEGLFCQPESATTLAALDRLRARGKLDEGRGPVVLILTGSGLKTPAALESAPIEIHRFPLAGLEAGLAGLG